MNTFRKPIDQITAQDIGNLITNQVGESLTLDYKEELHKKTASEDFYADYTAFANGVGGLIIYGLEEARDKRGNKLGYPSQIMGIDAKNVAGFIQQVEQALQAGVRPPIVGVRFSQVECENGTVLIVQIPRSLNAPHQITWQKKYRFHKRSESGNYRMEVNELRETFQRTSEWKKEAESFHKTRVTDIRTVSSKSPIRFHRPLILHAIPLGSNRDYTDPVIARKHITNLLPSVKENYGVGLDPWLKKIDMDGFTTWSGQNINKTIIRVFRGGEIEVVRELPIHSYDCSGHQFVEMDALTLENVLTGITNNVMDFMDDIEQEPPVAFFLGVIKVSNLTLWDGSQSGQAVNQLDPKKYVIDRSDLEIPEIIFSGDREQLLVQLDSFFDLIWQSAGHDGSPFVAERRAKREEKDSEKNEQFS